MAERSSLRLVTKAPAADAHRAEAKRLRDRARAIRLREVDHVERTQRGQVKPTPELEQHHAIAPVDTLVEHQGEKRLTRTRRVTNQTPLDRYAGRHEITRRQWKAGNHLRADWFRAGLEPRMVANLLGTGPGECAYGMAKTEAQAAARQDWRNALRAVGRSLWPILIHVVCEDGAAGDWAAPWRQRVRASAKRQAQVEGMTALRLALDALADHYGE